VLVDHYQPDSSQSQVPDLGGDMDGLGGIRRRPQPVTFDEAWLSNSRVQ
jgi:hypothetical protein